MDEAMTPSHAGEAEMTRAEIIPDTAARLFKVYLVGTWGREWIGNYETMDSAERVARAAENETIRDSRY